MLARFGVPGSSSMSCGCDGFSHDRRSFKPCKRTRGVLIDFQTPSKDEYGRIICVEAPPACCFGCASWTSLYSRQQYLRSSDCLRACQRPRLTSARRRGALFNDEYAQSIYSRISVDARRRGKRLGAGRPPEWPAAPRATDDAPPRETPRTGSGFAPRGPQRRPRRVGRAQGLGPRRLRERRGRAVVRVGRASHSWFFS